MLSPAVVLAGNAGQVLAKRQCALDAAYGRHPERFSKPPETLKFAKIVELNPEKGGAEMKSTLNNRYDCLFMATIPIRGTCEPMG